MKNNYQIKYANIPMFETENDKTEAVYYITIKCYVVTELKHFSKEGKESISYEVVTPYKFLESDIYNRQEPLFNKDKCSNAYIVKALYDSIEAASKEKEELNEGLYYRKYHRRSCNRKLLNITFNARKDYYEQLQSEIEKYTDGLIIGLKNKPQETYDWYNGRVGKNYISIYDSMKYFDNNYYTVRTVDYKDYANLEIERSNNRDIPDNLGKLLIANDPETHIRKVFLDEGCTYIKDDMIDNEIGEDVTFVINPDNVFYTLEDSNDIIKSYEKNNHSFILKRTK